MAEVKKYLGTEALSALVDQVKAEDVKTLDAAKAYSDSLAKNYDAVGSAATAKSEAIADADGKFATVNENIEKKADKTALEAEVTRATGKEAELLAAIEATDAIADKAAEDIAAINHAETGILKQAKDYADGKAAAVQGEVDALEEYVGVIPEGATATNIVGYVQEKTAGIATSENLQELTNRVAQAETDIDNIEKDYLKAVDKTELEGKITTAQNAADAAQGAVDTLGQTHATDKAALEASIVLKADQTALDAVSGVANAAVKQSDYDTKMAALDAEDARIVSLVEAEAALAREEEGKLNTRLVEVEAFFKTTEGETLDEALDTLVEIQNYVTGEGAAADQMVKDIAANKKSIEDHVATDHDFAAADTALKDELNAEIAKKANTTTVEGIDGRLTTAEGKITAAEGKITTLEGEMDAVEAAVATKAEAQDLTDAVAALEGADADQTGRIAALEEKFNGEEGSVADMIADAKQEAIDTAAGDATSKANKALEDAKKYADEEDAKIESRVEALESIDHDHANKAELDLIATGDKAKWDAAAAKAHEHGNSAELDKIVDGDVAKWNAAEQNAKDYADGLNNAMTTKVNGIDARVTQNTTDIALKADADDLEAAVERIETAEGKITALESSVNSFTPITKDEVDAYFA